MGLTIVYFFVLRLNNNYDWQVRVQFVIDACLITWLVWKTGDLFCVDPTQVEENVFEARLTVTTIEDGSIVAMQKGGSGVLTASDVDKMIDIALEKAVMLRKHL